MKLEDILQSLPSKEDITNAVRIDSRPSATGEILASLGIFGTGMILGAGLALLFAPKSGQEIRHDFAEKVGEMGHQLRSHMPQAAAASNGPST